MLQSLVESLARSRGYQPLGPEEFLTHQGKMQVSVRPWQLNPGNGRAVSVTCDHHFGLTRSVDGFMLNLQTDPGIPTAVDVLIASIRQGGGEPSKFNIFEKLMFKLGGHRDFRLVGEIPRQDGTLTFHLCSNKQGERLLYGVEPESKTNEGNMFYLPIDTMELLAVYLRRFT